MSATIENGVNGGLEGVVAFATEIAEPDRAGGALRYRGVDVEELVGRIPFEQVWGLLVDGAPLPGLPAAGEVATGEVAADADARRELQAAIARLPMRPLIDLDAEQARDELAAASAATLELTATIAREIAPWRGAPAPGDGATTGGARAPGGGATTGGATAPGDGATTGGATAPGDGATTGGATALGDGATAAARFLARWRGYADPAHARALDAYWITAAEH